jgi:hypothetical protein
MAAALIDHLEQHLGSITDGWSKDHAGEQGTFQIVRFVSDKNPGVVYSTLGLSNYPLPSRQTGKLIRHELVMVTPHAEAPRGIPGLLQQVGDERRRSGQAFLRGDVIGPQGKLWPDAMMEALYVSIPVFLPDSFASCATASIGSVVFAWLVPITANEAAYIRDHGWNEFEDRLVEQEVDLVNIHRCELQLAQKR